MTYSLNYLCKRSIKLSRLAEESKPNTLIKVLEFGAGTGILSGDILECFKSFDKNNVKGRLLSMEYDSVYADYLLKKYDNELEFTFLQEDSKVYDPPGKFDLIYSSFADHHIIRNEKNAREYFSNIQINLHQGSKYIVGDEFLPEHDYKNPQERIKALKKYHSHIIDKANDDYNMANDSKNRALIQELIELENEALESGIRAVENPDDPNSGDFKVSLKHYQERLKGTGLKIVGEPTRIGPQDDALSEEVGGIYVIEIKLA
ncbi:MAG: class I SAM-dependent methyltransferase [Cyanobacteria bacterium J06621_8]